MANSDFKELLSLFEDCEVRYLVVGGYAVIWYCEPSYTKDLDIWIDATPENARKVYQALAQFGAPLKDISPADSRPRTLYTKWVFLRRELTSSCRSAQSRSRMRGSLVNGELEGVPVWFIGREDRIQNKVASGRHIDLHDAEQLSLRPKHQ